jgi:hypothetical protein
MRNLTVAAQLAAGTLLGWPGGPVAAADSDCASMGGEIQGEQTCHVHVANATYFLDMTFPVS